MNIMIKKSRQFIPKISSNKTSTFATNALFLDLNLSISNDLITT